MTLTAVWLRLELRRRWRSLAVLALLVAFATATVLASVAGARRGDSAVDRLLVRTLPADITVLPNQPGFDWDAIRALSEVAAVTTFPVTGFAVDGIPEESVGFPIGDNEAMRTIERPVVLRGRLADPARADEVVISPRFPSSYHKTVGDTLTIRLLTPAQADKSAAGTDDVGAPAGPLIRAHIVGIVRSPWFADDVGSKGGLSPSAGLFAQYRSNILGTKEQVYINALVRLKGGEKTLPRFRADLARVSHRTDIDVWNNADFARHRRSVDGFESSCLLAFGMSALVAALFLIGPTVVRYTSATLTDLQILRAVGMSPRQSLLAASTGPFLTAVCGATLGVAGAVAASRWMPIGAAAAQEPHPGLDIDRTVLVTGWVLVPVLVLAGAAASAWLALAAGQARISPRRSAVAVAVAGSGLPVPVVIGTRFALEPGRGNTAVPVRPALLGAVVGVLGVLAAFTFSSAVSDAVRHPERFGQTHQLEGFFGLNSEDSGNSGPALAKLAADPVVTAVNDARVAVAQSGDTSITTYSYSPVGGKALPVVTISGRLPTAADEILLAPGSAHSLRAGTGSTVRLTGEGSRVRTLKVTGTGFVPQGPHNGYDVGAWATSSGYHALFGDTFKFHFAEISLRPGTDPAGIIPRLQRDVAPVTGNQPIYLGPAERPTEILEIEDVEVLPVVLGGFLLLLAVGAVGHALATAVRRRRHDVAVLRALGMTRGQSRLVVVTQATVLALVGLAFGIPLGLALGRTLWRQVAENTPLAYHPPLAVWALLLSAPVALLIANLLAAWPGHRAARLHLGQTLRTE